MKNAAWRRADVCTVSFGIRSKFAHSLNPNIGFIIQQRARAAAGPRILINGRLHRRKGTECSCPICAACRAVLAGHVACAVAIELAFIKSARIFACWLLLVQLTTSGVVRRPFGCLRTSHRRTCQSACVECEFQPLACCLGPTRQNSK